MYSGYFLEATTAGIWLDHFSGARRDHHHFSQDLLAWNGRGMRCNNQFVFSSLSDPKIRLTQLPGNEEKDFSLLPGRIYTAQEGRGLVALSAYLMKRHRIARAAAPLNLKNFEWVEGPIEKKFHICSQTERHGGNKVFITDGIVEEGHLERRSHAAIGGFRKTITVTKASFLVIKPSRESMGGGRDLGWTMMKCWYLYGGTGYFSPNADPARISSTAFDGELYWQSYDRTL